MSTEDRLSQLERSFVAVTELLRGHSERADTHDGWINELGTAQAETERKLAALVDAQIHSEDKLARLEAAMTRIAEAQARVSEAQERTEANLASLAERVERIASLIEGGGGAR